MPTPVIAINGVRVQNRTWPQRGARMMQRIRVLQGIPEDDPDIEAMVTIFLEDEFMVSRSFILPPTRLLIHNIKITMPFLREYFKDRNEVARALNESERQIIHEGRMDEEMVQYIHDAQDAIAAEYSLIKEIIEEAEELTA
ncbi:hypothetical protein MKZ38_007826 [Zalerion maritima]|uniref:Uncharacterized protein n=1 Tax=Zalerion maritima TaxID=339359 RepID=A0AAD5RHB0_9PEZI|nr:hypothetical protein MKZ38_007826 [Zalerion maritima]